MSIWQRAASSPTVWKRGLQALLLVGAYRKFKTTPAMFRVMVGFAAGLYTGVFTAQNYEIPKVTSPSEAWNKVTGGDKEKSR